MAVKLPLQACRGTTDLDSATLERHGTFSDRVLDIRRQQNLYWP